MLSTTADELNDAHPQPLKTLLRRPRLAHAGPRLQPDAAIPAQRSGCIAAKQLPVGKVPHHHAGAPGSNLRSLGRHAGPKRGPGSSLPLRSIARGLPRIGGDPRFRRPGARQMESPVEGASPGLRRGAAGSLLALRFQREGAAADRGMGSDHAGNEGVRLSSGLVPPWD